VLQTTSYIVSLNFVRLAV